MRVPLKWLQQYVPVEATAQEVETRLTMGGLEVEGIEESGMGPVLDVYITPNRGDCLSIVGVAREVAALYGLPLHLPEAPLRITPPISGNNEKYKEDQHRDNFEQTSVMVEAPDLCPRYAARIVRGLKIEPSPVWMQARLEAVGQRPINNIVDVTNYVMLELGQPLHAFDLHKLAGERIVVRRARDGETIKTLDGEERTLTSGMLVIADESKPVAIAGVMGGADSEVDENSVDILLESAHFDPLSVRRTSRLLKLRTEASYRFERVVDPSGVRIALDRVCQLLAEIGQPEAVAGAVDVYPQPRQPLQLTLRVSRAAALLGMDITTESATDCLRRLGFGIRGRVDSDVLNVEVPTFRSDITLEEDLIEEVGRIYGYENIPETLPIGMTTQGRDSDDGRLIDNIKRALVTAGLQEVVTHSLTAPSFFDTPEDAQRRVPVRNALSTEISGLRRSLTPTLLDVAKHNAAYQQSVFALFEVGRVWQLPAMPSTDEKDTLAPNETIAVAGLVVGAFEQPNWQTHGKSVSADYYTIRGMVEQLANRLGIAGLTFVPLGDAAGTAQLYHPGRSAQIVLAGTNCGEGDGTVRAAGESVPTVIGMVGELQPRQAATLPFRERIHIFELDFEALRQAVQQDIPRYRVLPRFPAVTRDLAPRLPLSVSYVQVEKIISEIKTRDLPLLETFRLTDKFIGHPVPEDQKSLTLSFTFRAPDRTMTEGEVNEAMLVLRQALESKCEAIFIG